MGRGEHDEQADAQQHCLPPGTLSQQRHHARHSCLTRQVGDCALVLVSRLLVLLGSMQAVALRLQLLRGGQAVLLLRAGLAHAGAGLSAGGRGAGREDS